MTVSINGTSGLVFNDASSQNTSAFTGGFAFRNRIINGDMRINQRALGTVNPINTDGLKYTVDRWWVYNSNASSKFSVQQSSDAPAGFSNSFLVTSSSAYSVSSSDEFDIGQQIEGFNFADMAWGTASARAVTLSFWVKSSLTGTFGGSLMNNAYNRSYPFTYSISSANTWEQKTITVAGDTTGTWVGSTNGVGLRVIFGLGVGSNKSGTAGAWAAAEYESATGATSVVGTNGATFYITGVQLEKGSTATSFDYRPYSTELQLAQRYYFKSDSFSSLVFNGSGVYSSYQFKVSMRAAPTVTAAYATGSVDRDGFYAQSGGVTGSSVVATAEL
jgi:hypothetical protein